VIPPFYWLESAAIAGCITALIVRPARQRPREGVVRLAFNSRMRELTLKKIGGVVVGTPGTGGRLTSASCRPFSFPLPSSPFFLLELWLLSCDSGTEVLTTGGLSRPPSHKM